MKFIKYVEYSFYISENWGSFLQYLCILRVPILISYIISFLQNILENFGNILNIFVKYQYQGSVVIILHNIADISVNIKNNLKTLMN